MSFAPYSLRMIDIRNLGRVEKAEVASTLITEALRIRDFGSDATFFGFKNPVLTVVVPGRKNVRNTVYNHINQWEEAARSKYGLNRKKKLVNRIEIDGDRVLMNGEEMLLGQDAEYWLRYRNMPLPCLELRFFATFMNKTDCDIILATIGVPSMAGLLQLLAPLVDAQAVFLPLLEAYGIKVPASGVVSSEEGQD